MIRNPILDAITLAFCMFCAAVSAHVVIGAGIVVGAGCALLAMDLLAPVRGRS